jgi:hypothetical protein
MREGYFPRNNFLTEKIIIGDGTERGKTNGSIEWSVATPPYGRTRLYLILHYGLSTSRHGGEFSREPSLRVGGHSL